ncbi:MAG: zinc-ribbon domain-containing protein, partial [Methanosarcinales archaeon]
MKFCPKCKTENKEQNKFCIKCGTMLPSSSIILDHLHTVILIFGIFGIISVMSAITGLNILFGKSIVHESDRITGIYFLIPIVVTFVIGYIIFKSTIKEQNLLPKPAIPLEQKATNLLKVESFMLVL